MSAPLYTLDILRLAAETSVTPRLTDPNATAERRSPVCGSRIVVDVVLGENGQIESYGHQVNACALGQASAALLARHIVGRSGEDIARIRDALAAYLAGSSETMPDWPGLELLAAARPYTARHAAIRLPFEAVADAAAGAKVH